MALDHEDPDRVPLDEPEGRFRSDTWNRLRSYFGTKDDEAIERKLGIDFRRAGRGISREFKKEAEVLGTPFDGSYKRLAENLFEDEWGIRYEMTSTKLHWRYAHHPLDEAEYLNGFEFPDLDAPGRFDEAQAAIRENGDDYVIEAHLWGTLFERAWSLRGFEAFITDLHRNSAFASKLLDEIMRYRMEEARRFIELGVDVIQLGDDFGMQTGMIISPFLWRRYFKPRMKMLIDDLIRHSRNDIYVFYHSCGYIEPIIPDLLEIGIDILNPIQPEAMDPVGIKERFGDRLVLHGTISIQRTLPFGSPDDVRNEVVSRIEQCGENGGLVIAPAHSPQPEVPVENLVTLYLSARRIPC